MTSCSPVLQPPAPQPQRYLWGQQRALAQLVVELQPLFEQLVLLLAQAVDLLADLLLVVGAAVAQLPVLLAQLLLQVLQAAGHAHYVICQGLQQRMLKGICSEGKSGPQPHSTSSLGEVTPQADTSQGQPNQQAQAQHNQTLS